MVCENSGETLQASNAMAKYNQMTANQKANRQQINLIPQAPMQNDAVSDSYDITLRLSNSNLTAS
jgi:hypothetical protein